MFANENMLHHAVFLLMLWTTIFAQDASGGGAGSLQVDAS